MSLLRESHDDLQKHLLRRSQCEDEIENFELLHSAISWPEGFRQLTAHGISSNDLDPAGYSILDIALGGSAGLGVVQYLLGLSMSFITPHTWFQANIFHNRRCDAESVEIVRCVAAQLAECSRNSRSILANEITYPAIVTMCHCLYHTEILSVVGAQALYDNGFTQIDYNKEDLEIPLLFHMRDYFLRKEKLDLIQWLYNKKRSLSKSCPRTHMSCSQILVQAIINDIHFYKAGYSIGYGLEERLLYLSKYRSMLADAFSDPYQDRCTCFCSSGGGDVMKIILTECPKREVLPDAEELGRFVLTEVFDLLRINIEEHPELLQSALRVKTFDRLGMTHTCSWIHTRFPYKRIELSEQEKSEIHCTERNDIVMLESLLTHFESEWSNYSGTFLEFLDSNWEPRMESVLAERRAIPIDREVLDDHGIKLVEYGPEEIPEPRSPDDKFEITWFQRVAEAIVDGREINEGDQ